MIVQPLKVVPGVTQVATVKLEPRNQQDCGNKALVISGCSRHTSGRDRAVHSLAEHALRAPQVPKQDKETRTRCYRVEWKPQDQTFRGCVSNVPHDRKPCSLTPYSDLIHTPVQLKRMRQALVLSHPPHVIVDDGSEGTKVLLL